MEWFSHFKPVTPHYCRFSICNQSVTKRSDENVGTAVINIGKFKDATVENNLSQEEHSINQIVLGK